MRCRGPFWGVPSHGSRAAVIGRSHHRLGDEPHVVTATGLSRAGLACACLCAWGAPVVAVVDFTAVPLMAVLLVAVAFGFVVREVGNSTTALIARPQYRLP